MSKATEFRAMMLQNMPLTYHVTIDADKAANMGHALIRREVSLINRNHSLFLQCHKNEDGSMTIWNNPEVPERVRGEHFERLVSLQRAMRDYQGLKSQSDDPNAYIPEMLDIQGQIDECLQALKGNANAPKVYQSPGKIHQPLNVILDHLAITEDIWNLLPPREQLKQRIKAQIEIRERVRAGQRPLKDAMKNPMGPTQFNGMKLELPE